MYVLDNASLRILLLHYYPDRFPTLWEKFDLLISEGRALSVREVYNELMDRGLGATLEDWIKNNRGFFPVASGEELLFITEIFKVNHFQYLVEAKRRLGANPVADPFVIAKAKIFNGIVVTEEEYKNNAAKIPNVCEYFGITCINLEEFMKREDWTF